ncbi:hypothetical protein RI367_004487 [Sorochytrium milnesiophthora]
MSSFNLEKELSFYLGYHSNKLNQLVHIVFVPLIFWTTLVWLNNTSALFETELLGYAFPVNGALLVTAVYALYYLILEPVAGTVYLPILLFEFVSAGYFLRTVPHANVYALGLHVLSWAMQIGAHQVFEKRSPALLDSLHQALLLAPLFVWLEVLFMFGYRKDLHKRIRNTAGVAIAKFRKEQRQAQEAARKAQ